MTVRRSTASALAIAAIVALGACADLSGLDSGGSTRATSGNAIFREAGCAGCHMLAAAGSKGQIGPNLDQSKPSAAIVEGELRMGEGAHAGELELLSDAQIKAVADYVARSAGR